MDARAVQALNSESKRRKVRKGTHSCWECKRRKVRCVFASSTDSICITCRRRGTKCVSQELPDEKSQSNDNVGRIVRVEALLNQLVQSVNHADKDSEISPSTRDHARLGSVNPTSSCAAPTVASDSTYPHRNGEVPPRQWLSQTSRTGGSNRPADLPQAFASNAKRDGKIMQGLLSSLPSRNDIEIVLNKVKRVSLLVYQCKFKARTSPQPKVFGENTHLINLLEPEPHPVLLARKMILLAAALQYFPPNEPIPGLSESHRRIMDRLVESATKMVTTNDALLGTMESLECIIYEGFYHVDAGNIRRAWIVFRRAVMAAQLMGLHRSDHHPVKTIESDYTLDPQLIWLAIVQMESTLSVLLGLPSSNVAPSITRFAQVNDSISEDDIPILHIRVLSGIIERNGLAIFSKEALDMTRDIDQQMIKIAERLPASFWRPIVYTGLKMDSEEALWESKRGWEHMCHYNLLSQLHLPYMLCPSIESGADYSRIACVSASREVLTRLIAFRAFNPITACCRMGDFMALIAGMTLMLAHIVSHCHKEMDYNIFIHQRRGDRALVEEALECMQSLSQLNEDVQAAKCAFLLERLLLVEDDAAQGQCYRAHKVQWTNDDHKDERNVLFISVPYVGTIRIARDKGILRVPAHQGQVLPDGITIGGIGRVQLHSPKPPSSPARDLFSNDTSCDSMPDVLMSTADSSLESTEAQPAQDSLLDCCLPQQNLFPDAAANLDDWILQGVDTAFFDNLMKGYDLQSSNDGANGNWAFDTPNSLV